MNTNTHGSNPLSFKSMSEPGLITKLVYLDKIPIENL